ncbi:hypothetical protein [Nonomuraea gerenzanensis]|uniref:hypothetical protein n=1 Tax=Nonomuraea gerenzanensis TaxID=93944 RepID=UPI001CD9DFF4|nr:hypothetical protein [Nonomuraea gerenzanensis]UBU09074.1 hypothetical protein LCN96_32400 [Nonomuraea gerenzanensis]
MTDLVESFSWASTRSQEWVQTGRDSAFLPSYWAAMTDRPMFYSRDFAHQTLGAHLLGLDTENLAMLRHFAGSATGARGWYPLWAFMFDGTPAAIDYRSDDDFVREIPAPFELVEKAVEQYRWTADERFLLDPVIAGFLRTTMTAFVELHDPLGTGVAGERGTGDFWSGTATYNEVERPPYLRVAADGIASQWAAHHALGSAAVLPADFAAWNRSRAAELRQHFSDAWWSQDGRHYTAGFTAEGPVAGFRLESTWFPALKGIMRADERSAAHLDFLAAGLEAAPPANIEAATYLPEAFLRYGRDGEALRWIRALAASRADYPEVPFTHVAHVATGLTGLEPGERPGVVRTRSHLPPGEWLAAGNVPVGGSRIGVRHDGREATELQVTGGPGVTWAATWDDGQVSTIEVPAGTRVRATPDGGVTRLPAR